MRHLVAALIAFAACFGGAQADVPVPPLKARVTDLTGTLTAQQQGELEAKIAAYETRRGSQIAVLLLPTTKPEEIEQYSIRVAEAWKIGRKGVDDGLILVVAKDDRRLRIEVGYGLEGVIPDSAASRVINETITPRFRDGDFYGGVRDGVDQLIKLAEGEKLPPPQAVPQGSGAGAAARALVGNPVAALFVALMVGVLLKAIFGRLPGSLLTAVGVGIAALLLFGIAFAVIGAIVAFIFTYGNSGKGGGGWSGGSGGGWSSGSSSSSSSSSWGGGGGGSFGGGGSSGRW